MAIRIDSAELGWSEGGRIGTRTLSRTEADAIGWFDGPPYGVVEKVFDEDEMEACSLSADDD